MRIGFCYKSISMGVAVHPPTPAIEPVRVILAGRGTESDCPPPRGGAHYGPSIINPDGCQRSRAAHHLDGVRLRVPRCPFRPRPPVQGGHVGHLLRPLVPSPRQESPLAPKMDPKWFVWRTHNPDDVQDTGKRPLQVVQNPPPKKSPLIFPAVLLTQQRPQDQVATTGGQSCFPNQCPPGAVFFGRGIS